MSNRRSRRRGRVRRGLTRQPNSYDEGRPSRSTGTSGSRRPSLDMIRIGLRDAKSDGGSRSALMRAFAKAAELPAPEPEITSDALADRLVNRFNQGSSRRSPEAVGHATSDEGPDMSAWRTD